jgi:hypothetical protein
MFFVKGYREENPEESAWQSVEGWCRELAGAKPVEELAQAALCPAGAVRVHEDQEPNDEDGQSDLCHVISLAEWRAAHKLALARSTASVRYLWWGLLRARACLKSQARMLRPLPA